MDGAFMNNRKMKENKGMLPEIQAALRVFWSMFWFVTFAILLYRYIFPIFERILYP